MNRLASFPAEAPRRGRGRLQLLLILAIVLLPMLLASAMYRFGFWVPDSRNYDGVLVADGRDRAALGVSAATTHRWELLVTAPDGCAQSCRRLVYLARQIHIGLARDATRAGHALASADSLDAAYEAQLRAEYPQLARYPLDPAVYRSNGELPAGAQLWIVDPHGNLVLRYGSDANGKAILEDLRHLLKSSQIG
ncbi:hypothetical protein ACRYHF_00705 [Stutzerimonas balearica]|uniref:hypothetical protein n=1 Tax=Stutzerimonas balearica TaxID=74829 RepID=UPI003F5BFF92